MREISECTRYHALEEEEKWTAGVCGRIGSGRAYESEIK